MDDIDDETRAKLEELSEQMLIAGMDYLSPDEIIRAIQGPPNALVEAFARVPLPDQPNRHERRKAAKMRQER